MLDLIFDALDSKIDPQFKLSVLRIKDRVAKFELQVTLNLHLHGTVGWFLHFCVVFLDKKVFNILTN